MSNDRLAATADRFAALVPELETAAAHAQTAARHFRDNEVPRGCAHAFALEGHLRKALADLESLAIQHAERSHV